MLETVAAYIEQHHLLPASGSVLVALSGGADSLCLLHLLQRLCGAGRRYPDVQLHVAHLNHMLRGEASAQDATYVAGLVSGLNLPFTLGEIDVPALACSEHLSLEEAARVARYRFLREAAHGSLIAVAHHADDQVETLLLHLLRGSGLSGMIGMRPRRQDIIRPLLAVRHAETVAYCQEQHLHPLEDASNSDPRFLRNRIRHELIPLLASMNPGIHATLLRNAEAVYADWEWIEEQVEQTWPEVITSQQEEYIVLKAAALQALPQALQRHLLQRVTALLCAGQSPLEVRHYQLIAKLLQGHQGGERTLHLPGHLQARHASDTLIFEHLERYEQQEEGTSITLTDGERVFSYAATALPLSIPGSIEVEGTSWIASAQPVGEDVTREVRLALCRQDWAEVWRLLPVTRYSVYIDSSSLDSGLWVRTRHTGDRIRPLGMTGEKKVQDVLVDKHIARAARASIPLFFSASHCIWIAGVQLDERARLTCETQRIVRLAIEPAS